MSTKVQLTGGAFQDPSGNLLVNGYLLMVLSQDGQVNGTSLIAAGVTLKIALNANGNVSTSPAQYVWPNDVISPANTFYTVSAYTAQGQRVWGPNAQQVFSPSPFDVSVWIPGETNLNAAPVITYDIGCFQAYTPVADETILLLPLERSVRFAANLAPSRASCGTNATATVVYSVRQNGSEFATVTFTSGVPTGALVSAGATFAAGDILTIVAPSLADTTLASVGILLSGVALS